MSGNLKAPSALRLAVSMAAVAAGLQLAPARADGQLDMVLMPPKVAPQQICAAAEPVDRLEGQYKTWDGKSDPGLGIPALRDAAKRLAAADARRFFTVSDKLLRYLLKVPDRKIARRAGIDLVRLYVDAERLDRGNAKDLLLHITTREAAYNPNSLYTLGQVYEQGTAVPRDIAMAISYYIAAAQLKHPDAVLRLAQYKLAGKLDTYPIDPKTAARMAFGLILADRNPDLCSRIKRIARAYAKGDSVVRPDHTVASAWLQLAADFGDADAAWGVAKYHLKSELLVKDNEILKKYLTLAAERHVILAMIELGRAYQDGTLFEQDRPKAEMWFRKAADLGALAGHIRLAGLFVQENGNRENAEKYERELRQISASPSAPTQVLVDLAALELERNGHSAGARLAAPLPQRAAAAGDAAAQLALAKLKLTDASDPRSTDDAVSLLQAAVAGGNSNAALELANFFACRGPQAPDEDQARLWREQALGAGNFGALVKEDMERPAGTLTQSEKELRFALLRSAALRNVADAIALVVDAYDKGLGVPAGGAGEQEWRRRLAASPNGLWRYAKILAGRSEGAESATDALRTAASAGSNLARMDLAKVLAADGAAPEMRAQARRLLLDAARAGRGEAVELLGKLLPDEEFRAAYEANDLAAVAEAKGDYRALIAAAKFAHDDAARKRRLAMAATVSDCSFTSAVRLADAYRSSGDGSAAAHWIGIARFLAEDSGEQQYRLARMMDGFGIEAATAQSIASYRKAAALGHDGAALRLFEIFADPKSPYYDADEAEAMLTVLMGKADPRILYATAQRLEHSKPELKRSAGGNAAIADLYRRSAEQGLADAMRGYGAALQLGSLGRLDPEEGARWLAKAAERGNSKAAVQLAKAYVLGMGVPSSLPKSLELLQTASACGDSEAASLLKAMKAAQPEAP